MGKNQRENRGARKRRDRRPSQREIEVLQNIETPTDWAVHIQRLEERLAPYKELAKGLNWKDKNDRSILDLYSFIHGNGGFDGIVHDVHELLKAVFTLNEAEQQSTYDDPRALTQMLKTHDERLKGVAFQSNTRNPLMGIVWHELGRGLVMRQEVARANAEHDGKPYPGFDHDRYFRLQLRKMIEDLHYTVLMAVAMPTIPEQLQKTKERWERFQYSALEYGHDDESFSEEPLGQAVLLPFGPSHSIELFACVPPKLHPLMIASGTLSYGDTRVTIGFSRITGNVCPSGMSILGFEEILGTHFQAQLNKGMLLAIEELVNKGHAVEQDALRPENSAAVDAWVQARQEEIEAIVHAAAKRAEQRAREAAQQADERAQALAANARRQEQQQETEVTPHTRGLGIPRRIVLKQPKPQNPGMRSYERTPKIAADELEALRNIPSLTLSEMGQVLKRYPARIVPGARGQEIHFPNGNVAEYWNNDDVQRGALSATFIRKMLVDAKQSPSTFLEIVRFVRQRSS